MTFESTLQLLPNAATRVRQRDSFEKSADKLRREHFLGLAPDKDGKLMHKEQIVDKDADYYFKSVVDPKTGEILRLCEEKLSDHVGRGSARKGKDV